VIRRVEFDRSFWDEVEAYFPPERDGRGAPSLADFQELVLPAIEFQLARGYDDLANAQPGLPIKIVLVQTPLGLAGAYAHLVLHEDGEVVHAVGSWSTPTSQPNRQTTLISEARPFVDLGDAVELAAVGIRSVDGASGLCVRRSPAGRRQRPPRW